MTVIELGDVAAGSGQQRPAREFDHGLIRRVLLVAVAVLTILSVTGSGRPEPRGVRTLWSVPSDTDDRYATDANTLYLAELDGGEYRLTAYRLADGVVRWRAPLGDTADFPYVSKAGRAVLTSDDRTEETRAFDSSTGALLWRLPGALLIPAGDLALLVHWNHDDQVLEDLRAVRIRTGELAWTRPGMDAESWTPIGSGPDRLVTVGDGGRTTVLRVSDGGTLATGTVDWIAPLPNAGQFFSVTGDDRHLYVEFMNDDDGAVSAYSLDTLGRLWHRDGVGRVSAYPCGPVLCGIEGDGYAAYDPDTGETRWRAAGVRDVRHIAPGLLLADQGAEGVYGLVDDRTGDIVADLGFGTPVQDDRTGTVYLLRTTQEPRDRTAISRVNLATGTTALRGVMMRTADFPCSVSGDILACLTIDYRLTVTAVG